MKGDKQTWLWKRIQAGFQAFVDSSFFKYTWVLYIFIFGFICVLFLNWSLNFIYKILVVTAQAPI